MYKIGKRKRFRKRLTFVVAMAVIASISFGVWGLLVHDSRGVVVSSDDRLITRQVSADKTVKVVIDEPLFRLELPNDWVLYKKEDKPSKVYYFKATQKNAGDRNLAIYIDADTKTYAVNRVVPVVAQNNKLGVGQMSDNCTQFTGTGAPSAQAAQSQQDTVARWQNIAFLCDLSHANRNAIGVSSSEGVNQVTLNGETGGSHRYFMLYTDHNDRPDYAIFNELLASFKAK
jgi:hypothetical protein